MLIRQICHSVDFGLWTFWMLFISIWSDFMVLFWTHKLFLNWYQC